MKRLGVLLGGVLCAACAAEDPSPETQVVIYVDTDAPLPPAPGDELAPSDHPPLFDTLRIDVFEPGAGEPCELCTREVAVDREMFQPRGISYGIMLQPGREGYRVRLRLFNTRHRLAGEPSPFSSIDTVIRLPAVSPGAVSEYHVSLPTDRVAAPRGSLDVPVDPQPGPLVTSQVGTWIYRTSCAEKPGQGEVCIPGGAYWMGDPQTVLGVDRPYDPAGNTNEQRLVIISPFFLDATEVTVGSFTPTGRGFFLAWSGETSGAQFEDRCTWSRSGERDSLAMNCVSWEAARGHCQARGADLPTEAQFEYAASGLRGDGFVWGDTLPSCEDAVWGRGTSGNSHACSAEPLAWPVQVGTGKKDRLKIAGNPDVVDLAGNVREWTLDEYQSLDGHCWPEGIVHDPLCGHGETEERTIRGGDFTQWPAALKAALRGKGSYDSASNVWGFRCARPSAAAE